jgi:hypothetical protein
MRVPTIVGVATFLVGVAGCSAELAQRPPANDPASVAATEAPFAPPPRWEPDPLLGPVPPTGAEPSPTGKEPAHSPTVTPAPPAGGR